MKKAYVYKFKSDVKPWANNGTLDFTDFVETRGSRGGRMVIHGISVHAILNLTVATAVIQGEDLYRAFRTITVEQKDGVRRYNEVPGHALRLISYAHNGADRTHEHKDAAVSTANFTVSAYLPITKRYVHTPEDFGLAAELLKTVKIACALGSDMSLGTSVVTVNSGTYWVIAECHEEMSVIQHAVDEWVVRDFDSTSQSKLITDGRLHDLYLYIPGANGGQTLANLTEAWIEQLMAQPLLKDPDLLQSYARQRMSCMNLFSTKGDPLRTDPFLASSTGTLRACAVLLANGIKCYEAPVRDNVVVKTTQSAALPANLSMIGRVIKPRSERVRAGIMKRYGLTNSYIRTGGKTRRETEKWSADHAAYMPEKFTA